MPFLTPNTADTERDAFATFLEQQCDQVRIAALGLDDAQLRQTHDPSSLSLAGLLAHVAQTLTGWLERVRVAPADVGFERLFELSAEIGTGEAMFAGSEVLDVPGDELRAVLARATERIRPIIDAADLDARVPVPDMPWFPKELGSWSVRWTLHHLIAEVARHVGHADLIRESIDGEIAYSLNARDAGETFDWAEYSAEPGDADGWS